MQKVKKTLYIVRCEETKTIHYCPYKIILKDASKTHIDTVEVEHIDPDTVPPKVSKADLLRQQRDELNAQIEALESEQ